MPRIIITTEPVSGAGLASRIARTLDQAEVPNVLWGWAALSLVGCNEGLCDLEFLIPDDMLEDAREAIIGAKLFPCQDPHCIELQHDYLAQGQKGPASPPNRARYHVPGTFHVHRSSACVITFHGKSALCPWLPDFEVEHPAANDPHLWVTTDHRFAPRGDIGPSGPWDGFYPTKVLNPGSQKLALDFLRELDADQPVSVLWDWMSHSLKL